MSATQRQWLILGGVAVAAYLLWCWWNSYAGTVDGTGHSRGFWSGTPFANWNEGA